MLRMSEQKSHPAESGNHSVTTLRRKTNASKHTCHSFLQGRKRGNAKGPAYGSLKKP